MNLDSQVASLLQGRRFDLGQIKTLTKRDHYLSHPVEWVEDKLGEFVWSVQRRIMESVRDNRRTNCYSCHRIGKGLPLDTPVPTPYGWTTIGEIRFGDEIFDENGQVCRVVATTSVWNTRCYKVTFSDGIEIITDKSHLWNTISLNSRNIVKQYNKRNSLDAPRDWRDYWSISQNVSTPEIMNSLRYCDQLNHCVPLNKAIDLPEIGKFLIDPYVLGAWLGDGTSSCPNITCDESDREIVNRIASKGENVNKISSAPFGWTMAGELSDRELLTHRLRRLNLLGNKHIPIEYLRSSINQRIELLRGLMDTDGFCGINGAVGIDLCNEVLANQVAELVRSLGIRVNVRIGPVSCPTRNGKFTGVRWRLSWTNNSIDPFYLTRKSKKWQESRVIKKSSQLTIRTVVSVEEVESVPTKCIQVSSKSGLYLATKWFVPTHNSFIAARIAFHWLDCHKPGEALVVTSAHSSTQVKMALWREMGRVHEKGKFSGRMNQTEYYMPIDSTGREEMVAFGRKPQDGDTTAFQGTYSKFILFIMDESCYVPQSLWDGAETLISNEHSRILAIGNPDDPNTEFARICAPGSGWNSIQVGYQDTPNFTGEDVPDSLKDMLIGPTWVEEKRKKWGEGSMLFVSKVLGQFPISSSEGLIPIQWVKAAQERTLIPSGPNELGVDVGAGHDKNIIAHRRGPVVRIIKKDANPDTMQTLSNVLSMLESTGAEKAKVDNIGIGLGAVQRAAEMARDQAIKRDSPDLYRRAGLVKGIDIREKADDTEHFVNLKAEEYWRLRERFESGEIDIDPDDDELANQLVNIRIEKSAGRIQVESKDVMKRRLNGKSPDELESLMLAFAKEKKKIIYEVSW